MSGLCSDCPRTFAETSGTRRRRARVRALASAARRAARRRVASSPTQQASSTVPATIHAPTSLHSAPAWPGILPARLHPVGRDGHTVQPGATAQKAAIRRRNAACARPDYQWMPRISEAKIIASLVAVRCASPSRLPCAAAESGNMR